MVYFFGDKLFVIVKACFDSLKFNQWLEFHLIQLLYGIWKLTSAEPKSTMSCALIYIYGS